MEGIEVRELPPEHVDSMELAGRNYFPQSVQHAREIRIAYENGAQDRFSALLGGILTGAASGAALMALLLL